MKLATINEQKRYASPAVTPQALAWHGQHLWMGSRDLRRIYVIDVASWKVVREVEPPGIPWAAASTGEALRFTLGEGAGDDRYVRRYDPEGGFGDDRMACPDFTGSYLSHDGRNLYLSQWYKHRILKLDEEGNILRAFDVGAEISGHTWVDGMIHVLRGTEENGESWRIARFDPKEEAPEIMDLAEVPFACRSLAFDGERFWSNHRAGNEIVAFGLP